MAIIRQFTIYLSLFPILLLVIKPMSSQNFAADSTKSIYDFWMEQDKLFKLGAQKDIVLLLGNTGSGKSTTALFIIGANLTAEETCKGCEEFIIVDNNGKIGNETTKSHTLIPEMMIDTKTDTAYYDCPGFLDTRSAAHDITIAYFLNKLLTYANSLKLLFVVSHSSVKKGESRGDFPNLIKNAVKLIKDIDKYSDGIALIATKVEATVSDAVVVRRVANFLEETKTTLIADGNATNLSAEQKKLNEQSVKFVETLLTKKNGESYERIGLFRRADEAGPLLNSPKMRAEKAELDRIINQNLKYIRRENDDFGFIISSDSKAHVVQLISEIVKTDFVADVSKISAEIKEFFIGEEKQSSDIDNLHDKFKLANQMLTDAVRADEPRMFLRQIVDVIDKLHAGPSTKTLESVVKHIQYIDFLANVSNQNLTSPVQLANELSKTKTYIQNARTWYRFLIELHEKVSKQKFQNSDMKKIANELANQPAIGENELKNVADIGLTRLLSNTDLTIYTDVEAMKINSYQLKALKNVLNEYSKDNVFSTTCTSNQLNMTVKGRVIKMSDVIKNNCFSKAKYIEIFALNTMIIDEMVNKSQKDAQILIISPNWDVFGDREVLLNGENGRSHATAAAKNGIGGVGFPGNGDHGLPGFPGVSAGSFLALGDQFINGQYLTIRMTGGNGGPAQHGGNGTKGIEGKDAPLPENCWVDVKRFWDNAGFDYSDDWKWTGTGTRGHYVVFGKNGTKAGDGGNGGRQSSGGYGGKALLFELDKASKFDTQSIKGKNGSIGIGGFGGGGETHNGKTYHIQIEKSQPSGWAPATCDLKTVKTIDYGKNEAAKNGINDVNEKDLSNPEPAPDFHHLSFTLNKYKSFVREHMAGSVRATEMRKFLNKMSNNEKVKLQYDTLGLVNELHALEYQYFRLRNKISFIPFFESLLDRVDDFARTKADKLTLEHKKVLSYLYTAVVSKICGIKNKVNKNTVFDLDAFLEVVEGNINELKESVAENNINIVQNDYKSSLDEKIRSANDFIDKQITPEITNIFRQIDEKITALIDESLKKQNATAEAIKDQKKRRRELEEQIRLRRALGPFKLIASAASFFGPVGAAAGTAIGGSSMIIESLFLDENSAKGNDKIGSLVNSDFKNAMSRMSETLKQKPDLIKQKIYDLDKFVKEHLNDATTANAGVSGAEIRAIKEKIKNCKKSLDGLKGDGDVPEYLITEFNKAEKELKDLSKEAKTKLEQRKSELTASEKEAKQEIEKQLRVVTYVQAVVNLADVTLQLYNQVRNDEAKLKLVSDVVAKLGKDLQTLKDHEGKIYNIMIPQIRKIEDTVNGVSKNLTGNSHVELDIKKWNIRSTLSEIRMIFNQMTKDFKVHDVLDLSLKKLDEGMATLIDVYDRIDSYSDNAKLAAYIANIGSRKSSEIVIRDVELSQAVTSLQKMIRSNLVLEEYEMTMHAFKQQYFPLAQFFLKKFELPETLRMNDTSSLIQKTVDQLTDLKKKIKTSHALFNEYDESMHSDVDFDGKFGSMPPFYTWKNEAIKNETKKLLKGEAITIKAEVANGVNQNGIKFNDIGLRIKLSDSTLQTELDKELRNFSVIMTMTGNNYYRCNNRFYSISLDRNLMIDITFERKTDGTPKDPNDVYKKIHKNRAFLSPYTMWTITLSGDFNKLTKFVNEKVDLELIGGGQYLKHGNFTTLICNERLDKYYNFDKTISNADNVIYSKNF